MSNFDNIGGIYAKDSALRQSVNNLRTTVTSKTIKPLTVTNDGIYTANPADGVYGYSPVTVSVNPPWQPLEDGYSNFWFELNNDTLSPWLNFSAKNNNATIDWGDGSGEVALDTLTPTHTYAKAGRYVVKAKGITGIAQQNTEPYQNKYLMILKAVELNDEVTTLANSAFTREAALEHFVAYGVQTINPYVFWYNSVLNDIRLPNVVSIGNQAFNICYCLKNITLPNSCTTINGQCFNECKVLTEIHVKSTTPPTLGANVFANIASGYIIYVPVGYGETYKAASGWSTYADHIVEEGQTLSNAALRRIQAENNDDIEEMR